jgi:hypothetical protein
VMRQPRDEGDPGGVVEPLVREMRDAVPAMESGASKPRGAAIYPSRPRR